ncbi:MAG: GNAT family N-acetyltransferase [Anaerolineae bacterium]
MSKLNGGVIYLRQFNISDIDAVFSGVQDPVGMRLTGTHGTFTREQIEAYVQNNIEGKGRYAWIICLPDDTVIGEVVINEIDENNRNANIRIALFDPQFYGKGYGTTAMRLAVKYGFEQANLHRIELGVFDFNPRAIRVYEKVGFKLEGTLRDVLLWEGDYHNQHIMSILEDEWQNEIE